MVVRRIQMIPLVGAVLVASCTAEPIRWHEDVVRAEDPAPESTLAFDAEGRPRFVRGDVSTPVAPAADACPGSLRTVELTHGARRSHVAVWWSPRGNGSAALLAAESTDGGHSWSARTTVDTLDRGTTGCARPAPAVAADPATGYVHVAYPLWAPEGPGIFFAHTMPGHFMFHQPAVVTYGERPGRVSVAASGNEVVVAYEDPNARSPRIGLALSRSQGHVFEHRALEGTGPGDASAPHVALRGDRIALAWTRAPFVAAGVAEPQRPVTLLRTGRLLR